ncbi:ankyrin repeat domain-containing protein [Brachybacterium muris]|uniref:ankyrin repeat domain-containing protein n=1 Tax=Brachybacterium muris TaxID=219301 RepID=UPI0021A43403|nr:ankyrin repeat domain-containing protein [Brachybacterium muris]MCT1998661.1 ankyrin repeat domain-containing protein [Brachybacterium muris]
MTSEWQGVLDPDVLNGDLVDHAARLADAAKAGRWGTVLDLVEHGTWSAVNQWRITGRSWFTPLHQAAWLGAPVGVAERLLLAGAWRSLRTAEGGRPLDIARQRGHHHLLEALAVRDLGAADQRRVTAWDSHLADLIAERTRPLAPVRFRPVPTELLVVERMESLWVPYPGMYGGFSLSVHRGRLVVESWSRVAGGSGQAHVITESGSVMVEEGFA